MLLTQPGQWLGTPHYMSPEQGMVKSEIDHRSDIYSLGCTLYKLLTGETPFGNEDGATVLSILIQHANADFPKITNLRPEVPKGLMRILNRMVAKSPGERLASAAEVARMLEPYCKGSNLEALYGGYLSGGLEEPLHRPTSRKSLVLALVLIPLVAVLVLLAASVFWPSKPKDSSTDLLTEIDPNRDSVAGSWELQSGLLISSEKDAVASLRLPQTMPAEFELEITAKRRSGIDLWFVNLSDKTPFALALDLRASAVDRAAEKGKTFFPNWGIHEKGWAIENPNPQTFLFRVKRDRFIVQRDGQTLIDETRYPELPGDHLPGIPGRHGFYIATLESKYEFSLVRFTPMVAEE
jgi:serine/threonine protein kinase